LLWEQAPLLGKNNSTVRRGEKGRQWEAHIGGEGREGERRRSPLYKGRRTPRRISLHRGEEVIHRKKRKQKEKTFSREEYTLISPAQSDRSLEKGGKRRNSSSSSSGKGAQDHVQKKKAKRRKKG